MVPAFMALWFIGGWLVLMCSVLIWTERVVFMQRTATCGKCGYDLAGLQPLARCPECNSAERKLEPVGRTVHGPQNTAAVWLAPLFAGLLQALYLSIPLKAFGAGANLYLLVSGITFVAFSLLINGLMPWLPKGAPTRLMVAGTGAMTASHMILARIVLDQGLKPDLGLLGLVPVLIWPFCGFGLFALVAASGHRNRRRLG